MTSRASNPFSVLWRLVGGEQITPFVRCICIALAAALVAMGYEPLFHPNATAYQNPVFDLVRRAPLQLWGSWFVIEACLMLFAALTARAVWYVIAVVLTTITLSGWAIAVIAQDWRSAEADLTSGAIGLYLFAYVAVLGLAFSPRQLAAERPIVTVTEDGTVTPLRRAS